MICPHLNTAHFQGALPDDVWLKGCLELVKRSDALYMLSGYLDSKGSVEELELAEKLGKEIYYEE